jgi:extensin-like protein
MANQRIGRSWPIRITADLITPPVRCAPTIAATAVLATAVLAGLACSGPAVAQSAATPQGPDAQARASACQARLTPDRAVFKAMGELAGPGSCGGPDVVHLERIVLADRSEIAVEPPATLRCEMAEAIVHFVRQDLAPAAATMGSPLRIIENFDSYDCRGRNRVTGAQLSQHGLANALDIRAVRLRDGRTVRPADAGAPHEFRVAMKAAVCNRFTTVLGPGSDGYHEDHIHVDLAERRGGYRLCQWDLHDGTRDVARGRTTDSVVAQAASVHTYMVQSVAPTRTLPALVPLPRPRPFALAGAPR